ncbi:hypothetical protein ANO11243_075510 [Dothideomycetidae sp. 11243]|nr:hypothetical protein ANO11243_075510 [fungal sp. No.11243]
MSSPSDDGKSEQDNTMSEHPLLGSDEHDFERNEGPHRRHRRVQDTNLHSVVEVVRQSSVLTKIFKTIAPTSLRHGLATSLSSSSILQLLDSIPWKPSMLFNVTVDPTFHRNTYTSNFGKSLIILDVDTRSWLPEPASNMSELVWGRLNHYIYAKMHGYDYKFIHAPNPHKDTHATWAKLPAILDTLKEGYKFVVFTDSDVIFPHLKIPLEYLLERWDITSEIALAMALVPDGETHRDSVANRTHLNSGFMIAQNIPVAHDMLKDWIACPTEAKFKGCAHWKQTKWHEQSAFGNYVRYAYPGRVRELPCDEANGNRFLNLTDPPKCGGKLVSHFWKEKDKISLGVQASVAEMVLPGVVDDMMREWVVADGS